MPPGRKSVLLLGATGLVGRECLRLLVEHDGFSRGLAFPFPARLRPSKASDVARALVHQAILDESGRRVLLSPELRQISSRPFSSEPSENAAPLAHETIAQSLF